jgi:hypothetical protein
VARRRIHLNSTPENREQGSSDSPSFHTRLKSSVCLLLDYISSTIQHFRRNRQAQGFGRVQIDDQLSFVLTTLSEPLC